MKAIILLGATALPLAVHGEGVLEATQAPQSYTVIDVEYWGTISAVGAGSRRVGDAISGSMRIDLRFAPSDFWDTFASEGEYIWNFPCERNCEPYPDAPSRFVATSGAPVELGGNSFDRVYVFDQNEVFRADEFSVRDWELGSGTGEDHSELRVFAERIEPPRRLRAWRRVAAGVRPPALRNGRRYPHGGYVDRERARHGGSGI